ncbi:MAG: transposase [Clostridia bacterium]|nr:transposase [Clostridia bacterium]
MKRITQEARWRQHVMEYFQKHGNGTKTALRYHISRKTLYKWKNRWDGTPESLCDQSRRPHKTREGHNEHWIRLIRRLCKKHRWTDIIVAYQEAVQRYAYPFTYQTFKKRERELLEAKKSKRRKRKNKPYERASYPGQKVQVDVKFVPGDCVAGSEGGKKYYVYIAVDECSRWTYRQMYDEHSTYCADLFLQELIRNVPFQIRMIQTDNGSEFTKQLLTSDKTDLTLFEQRMKEYGIQYHRIRPATPRHNGKVERQNRLDQDRFYDHLRMFSLTDGRNQLAAYQKKSNTYWKTCLGMKSPNEIVEMYTGVM